jgi:hypothetical protein
MDVLGGNVKNITAKTFKIGAIVVTIFYNKVTAKLQKTIIMKDGRVLRRKEKKAFEKKVVSLLEKYDKAA